MSTNLAEVAPLSDSVQMVLRIPVILLTLAGLVLALVLARRFGVLSAVLAATGSAVVAADQIVNVAWAYTNTALSHDTGTNFDKVVSTNNLFTVVDAVLITIGIGLLVFAYVVRRPVHQAPPAYPAPPPAYPTPGYGQPPPGYPAPPPVD
jgi:hypothetical protein